jgi:hypothetical protein
MMAKPLTQAETDDLNSVLERIAQRLERHQRWNFGSDQYRKELTAILQQLRNEPRDE